VILTHEQGELTMLTPICPVAAIVLLLGATVDGIPVMDYDDLQSKADVIIIARFHSKKNSEKTLKYRDQELQGVESSLDVLACVKGATPNRVRVLHYVSSGPIKFENGPALVDFEDQLLRFGKHKIKITDPRFLVFLNKADGDLYRPVSDPLYSAMSVKFLFSR